MDKEQIKNWIKGLENSLVNEVSEENKKIRKEKIKELKEMLKEKKIK